MIVLTLIIRETSPTIAKILQNNIIVTGLDVLV